ncbi:hypothetical protein MNBD_DELTA02-1210 [hydrothermal vent metagenome]|uniref:Uncharacterized protein n=1 Tax=hydrothermal vent metagenome TaxID=652676 RepID=A0A3B0VGI1_9ZZZZ
MHDRSVVISPDVVSVRYMLGKVTLAPGYYICPVNRHKGITVLAALLVPEPHGMADLMDGITGGTTGAKLDKLVPANAADVGPATGTGPELYVVRIHRLICSGPKDKTNPCVGLPMRDRIGYTALVGKSTVYCVRNNTVRPSARRQNHNTCGYLPAYFSAPELGTTLDLLDGAEDDIALKHRKAVNFGVLHFL